MGGDEKLYSVRQRAQAVRSSMLLNLQQLMDHHEGCVLLLEAGEGPVGSWPVLYANNAWAALSGLDRDEAAGRPLQQLLLPADTAARRLLATAGAPEGRGTAPLPPVQQAIPVRLRTAEGGGGPEAVGPLASLHLRLLEEERRERSGVLPAGWRTLAQAMYEGRRCTFALVVPGRAAATQQSSEDNVVGAEELSQASRLQGDVPLSEASSYTALLRGADKVPGLEVGAMIGKGGFGSVFSGTLDGRPVAVKKIDLSTNRASLEGISLEAVMGQTLEHSNVVRTLLFLPRYRSSADGGGGGGGSGRMGARGESSVTTERIGSSSARTAATTAATKATSNGGSVGGCSTATKRIFSGSDGLSRPSLESSLGPELSLAGRFSGAARIRSGGAASGPAGGVIRSGGSAGVVTEERLAGLRRLLVTPGPAYDGSGAGDGSIVPSPFMVDEGSPTRHSNLLRRCDDLAPMLLGHGAAGTSSSARGFYSGAAGTLSTGSVGPNSRRGLGSSGTLNTEVTLCAGAGRGSTLATVLEIVGNASSHGTSTTGSSSGTPRHGHKRRLRQSQLSATEEAEEAAAAMNFALPVLGPLPATESVSLFSTAAAQQARQAAKFMVSSQTASPARNPSAPGDSTMQGGGGGEAPVQSGAKTLSHMGSSLNLSYGSSNITNPRWTSMTSSQMANATRLTSASEMNRFPGGSGASGDAFHAAADAAATAATPGTSTSQNYVSGSHASASGPHASLRPGTSGPRGPTSDLDASSGRPPRWGLPPLGLPAGRVRSATAGDLSGGGSGRGVGFFSMRGRQMGWGRSPPTTRSPTPSGWDEVSGTSGGGSLGRGSGSVPRLWVHHAASAPAPACEGSPFRPTFAVGSVAAAAAAAGQPPSGVQGAAAKEQQHVEEELEKGQQAQQPLTAVSHHLPSAQPPVSAPGPLQPMDTPFARCDAQLYTSVPAASQQPGAVSSAPTQSGSDIAADLEPGLLTKSGPLAAPASVTTPPGGATGTAAAPGACNAPVSERSSSASGSFSDALSGEGEPLAALLDSPRTAAHNAMLAREEAAAAAAAAAAAGDTGFGGDGGSAEGTAVRGGGGRGRRGGDILLSQPDEVWMVMEYCDRGTLQSALERGLFALPATPGRGGSGTASDPTSGASGMQTPCTARSAVARALGVLVGGMPSTCTLPSSGAGLLSTRAITGLTSGGAGLPGLPSTSTATGTLLSGSAGLPSTQTTTRASSGAGLPGLPSCISTATGIASADASLLPHGPFAASGGPSTAPSSGPAGLLPGISGFPSLTASSGFGGSGFGGRLGPGCPPRRAIDLRALFATALEVASALRYLHGLGIVHGDLTGQNVMLVSLERAASAEGEHDFAHERSLSTLGTASLGSIAGGNTLRSGHDSASELIGSGGGGIGSRRARYDSMLAELAGSGGRAGCGWMSPPRRTTAAGGVAASRVQLSTGSPRSGAGRAGGGGGAGARHLCSPAVLASKEGSNARSGVAPRATGAMLRAGSSGEGAVVRSGPGGHGTGGSSERLSQGLAAAAAVSAYPAGCSGPLAAGGSQSGGSTTAGGLGGGETVVCRNCGRNFIAKVADFGLSRLLDVTSKINTRAFGMITYMPPETLVDGIVSKASDVYSFGVLLWHMATGQRPWAGYNTGQIVYHVGMKNTQLPFPPDTHPGLLRLSRACTAAAPRERPTARRLQEELAALAAEVGVEVEGLKSAASLEGLSHAGSGSRGA